MHTDIIVHGCRLRLSPMQMRWLSTLLSRPGKLVRDADLCPAVPSGSNGALAKAMSRMRERIHPHGYVIYRVVGHGFVLVEEQQEDTGQ